MDANIPSETLAYVCDECERSSIPVWYNPTDYRKCSKIVQTNRLSKLTYMSPNYKELILIFKTSVESDQQLSANEKSRLLELCNEESIDNLKIVLKYLVKFVPIIVVSRGENDLILASRTSIELNGPNKMPRRGFVKSTAYDPHLYLFPTLKLAENEVLKNVSGAGDSALAGLVAGILKGWPLVDSVYNGLLAAKLSIQTNQCISDKLDFVTARDVKRAVGENELNIKVIRLN